MKTGALAALGSVTTSPLNSSACIRFFFYPFNARTLRPRSEFFGLSRVGALSVTNVRGLQVFPRKKVSLVFPRRAISFLFL